ncbi:hypothetical protein JTB14_016054 [Gonioctena quinquepunctata]|nr:hypothetical protein JTB14_016054 [Gonioctena quinquepunctata]
MQKLYDQRPSCSKNITDIVMMKNNEEERIDKQTACTSRPAYTGMNKNISGKKNTKENITDLIITQTEIMKSIINLEEVTDEEQRILKPTPQEQKKNENSEIWQTVQRSRKRSTRKNAEQTEENGAKFKDEKRRFAKGRADDAFHEGHGSKEDTTTGDFIGPASTRRFVPL